MDASVKDGPDFVCIGMQKAGTIWLHDQLGSHPGAWQLPIKELHVLNEGDMQRSVRRYVAPDLVALNEKRLRKNRRELDDRDMKFLRRYEELAQSDVTLDAYARLFELKGNDIAGDITPGYSVLNSEQIGAVVKRFPSTRFLIFVREPLERAWSSFSMRYRRLNKDFVSDTVVFDDWGIVFEHLSSRSERMRSFPSRIVRRWKRETSPENFRVFFFDDLKDNAKGLLGDVAAFIGLDAAGFVGAEPTANRKQQLKKLVMSENIKERLLEHFSSEILDSATELGGRAQEWPARYGL